MKTFESQDWCRSISFFLSPFSIDGVVQSLSHDYINYCAGTRLIDMLPISTSYPESRQAQHHRADAYIAPMSHKTSVC